MNSEYAHAVGAAGHVDGDLIAVTGNLNVGNAVAQFSLTLTLPFIQSISLQSAFSVPLSGFSFQIQVALDGGDAFETAQAVDQVGLVLGDLAELVEGGRHSGLVSGLLRPEQHLEGLALGDVQGPDRSICRTVPIPFSNASRGG